MIDFTNFKPFVIDTFEAFRVKTDSQKNIIAYGSADPLDVKFVLPHIPNTYLKEVKKDNEEGTLDKYTFACQIKNTEEEVWGTVGGELLDLEGTVRQALAFQSIEAQRDNWYQRFVRVYNTDTLEIIFAKFYRGEYVHPKYPEVLKIVKESKSTIFINSNDN